MCLFFFQKQIQISRKFVGVSVFDTFSRTENSHEALVRTINMFVSISHWISWPCLCNACNKNTKWNFIILLCNLLALLVPVSQCHTVWHVTRLKCSSPFISRFATSNCLCRHVVRRRTTWMLTWQWYNGSKTWRFVAHWSPEVGDKATLAGYQYF